EPPTPAPPAPLPEPPSPARSGARVWRPPAPTAGAARPVRRGPPCTAGPSAPPARSPSARRPRCSTGAGSTYSCGAAWREPRSSAPTGPSTPAAARRTPPPAWPPTPFLHPPCPVPPFQGTVISPGHGGAGVPASRIPRRGGGRDGSRRTLWSSKHAAPADRRSGHAEPPSDDKEFAMRTSRIRLLAAAGITLATLSL